MLSVFNVFGYRKECRGIGFTAADRKRRSQSILASRYSTKYKHHNRTIIINDKRKNENNRILDNHHIGCGAIIHRWITLYNPWRASSGGDEPSWLPSLLLNFFGNWKNLGRNRYRNTALSTPERMGLRGLCLRSYRCVGITRLRRRQRFTINQSYIIGSLYNWVNKT
jgi:hypothetical protein